MGLGSASLALPALGSRLSPGEQPLETVLMLTRMGGRGTTEL